MTDDERKCLESAFDQLYDLADKECYGQPDEGQEHRCSCSSCIARRARERIAATLDPPHVSLQENRLTSPPERVFLEKWRKENERHPAVNSGFTLLEWICCPGGQKLPDRVNNRDAQVAASVVQWLGTNCGLSFILECEREIKRLEARFRGVRPIECCFPDNCEFDELNKPEGERSADFDMADYVAGQFFPMTNERQRHLRSAILRCMAKAVENAKPAEVPA